MKFLSLILFCIFSFYLNASEESVKNHPIPLPPGMNGVGTTLLIAPEKLERTPPIPAANTSESNTVTRSKRTPVLPTPTPRRSIIVNTNEGVSPKELTLPSVESTEVKRYHQETRNEILYMQEEVKGLLSKAIMEKNSTNILLLSQAYNVLLEAEQKHLASKFTREFSAQINTAPRAIKEILSSAILTEAKQTTNRIGLLLGRWVAAETDEEARQALIHMPDAVAQQVIQDFKSLAEIEQPLPRDRRGNIMTPGSKP